MSCSRLSPKALALACGLLWGGVVLLTGLLNWMAPPYGKAFLRLIVSIYPGYHAEATFGQLVLVTVYALLDGAIGGWILAWLYNRFVPAHHHSAHASHRN